MFPWTWTLKGAAALGLILAGPVIPALAAEPKVVVTVKPIHSLVSQIMEGVGTPVLIVDGSASPHTFTLKPSGAKAINEANVFIRVSENLEPFTRKIVAALPSGVKLISLSEAPGIILLDQRQGGTFEKHEHHDDDDDKHIDAVARAKDGHIWLDPLNAKAIVEDITKVLANTYPDYADKLNSNSLAVIARISELSTELENQLLPIKGKPFVVFHDAYHYFENRFGLVASGSITVGPDVQPGAKRLTEVRQKIGELGSLCVFAEPGFQPKLIAALTEGTVARHGILDPEGVALSAGPGLYFDLMRGIARGMAECLSK